LALATAKPVLSLSMLTAARSVPLFREACASSVEALRELI
jgi:hypothetical protein